MKPLLWFFCLFLLVFKVSLAQQPIKQVYASAIKAYNENNLKKASMLANKCITADSLFSDAFYLKAKIAELQEDYCYSLFLFNKAAILSNKKYTGNLYDLYRYSVSCSNYSEAERFVILMKEENNNKIFPKEIVDSLLKNITAIRNILNNPLDIKLQKLSDNINTNKDEYITAISSTEKEIFFTRSVKGLSGPIVHTVKEMGFLAKRDIYINGDYSIWDTVYNFDSIYPQFNGGSCFTLSPDGKFIFFVGCNRSDGYGSCDIYQSENINGKWTNPVNLGKNVNSKYWDSQPCMSSDGCTLFFASNRPGGYGKSDIWFSKKNNNGEWEQAKNLGNKINTSKDEKTPFIHFDAHTLYFSSDGHPGLGGMDIFKININNPYDSVINIGFPINNKDDQQCFLVSPDGKTAFISSTNDNNNVDIFYFAIPVEIQPSPVKCFEGSVVDAVTGKGVKALIEFVNNSNNTMYSITSNIEGGFNICFEEKEEYGIVVTSPNYLIYSDNNINTCKKSNKVEIKLFAIKEGQSFFGKNIIFEYDSYELKNQSFFELDRIIATMKENQFIKFEIVGHTDNQGSDTYNITLSKNRAKVVFDYLVAGGIDANRLTYRGEGSRQAIGNNSTEEGRAMNRRTEFIVM